MSNTCGIYVVYPHGTLIWDGNTGKRIASDGTQADFLFNHPLNDADDWCQRNADILVPGNRFKIGVPVDLT